MLEMATDVGILVMLQFRFQSLEPALGHVAAFTDHIVCSCVYNNRCLLKCVCIVLNEIYGL